MPDRKINVAANALSGSSVESCVVRYELHVRKVHGPVHVRVGRTHILQNKFPIASVVRI